MYIEGDGKHHYVYMKDVNRFMFSFTGHEHKKHFVYIVWKTFLQKIF